MMNHDASFKSFVQAINGILISTDYDIRGAYIWLPYGIKFRSLAFNQIFKVLEKQGYPRYEFPLFVAPFSLKIFNRNFNFLHGFIQAPVHDRVVIGTGLFNFVLRRFDPALDFLRRLGLPPFKPFS